MQTQPGGEFDTVEFRNRRPASGVLLQQRTSPMKQSQMRNQARIPIQLPIETWKPKRACASALLLASVALAGWCAGCRVNVDKGSNGEDKKVQIDTPFGGVHVNTDQTTAADLGLPVYPGAQMVQGDDQHKSADVHLGFGEWELRVRAVDYSTPDSRDKVVAFYKSALGRYGNVITCDGNKPVGQPAATSEGLTCDDSSHGHVKVETNGVHTDYSQYSLKAGSERHQHIVGFDESSAGQTRFALVALDLPSDMGGSDKSD
jgi:hypothetical protein